MFVALQVAQTTGTLHFFCSGIGQKPQYWINLQATYDLKMAEKVIGRRIAGIHELAHA
jgi:plasmid maintenance system antidote protein VapI